MPYDDTIRTIGPDADQLELAYRSAVMAGEGDAFTAAISAVAASEPENLLYAAWRARLAQPLPSAPERAIAWHWAVPLAVLNGLVLWLLSGERYGVSIGDRYGFPAALLFAAPVSAVFVLAFLVATGARRAARAGVAAAALGSALVGAGAYAYLVHPQVFSEVLEEQYVSLMILHLPLLAWAAVAVYLLGLAREPLGRFAFLVRSLEVFIAGGLFGAACGLFTGISAGLFQAIDIELPELVQRLFVAGGGGLIPVLAVAVVYQPAFAPARQTFEEGLSRFIATLMRVLLPLTLFVLVVYAALIPFNFRAPFENREVLIIYTAMLFAVLALLAGATPVPGAEPSGRTRVWLKRALIATAAAALVVGSYALAAIVYRTVRDGFTPNRLAFIGWIVVALAVYALALLKQARARRDPGFGSWRATFAAAMPLCAAWATVVVLAMPWVFASAPEGYDALPSEIQSIVATRPSPILVKCSESPHIYLVEGATKRWIRDIPTFEAEGYTWYDVQFVSCDAIQEVPNGPPIPSDAGPPPEPVGP